ncbi:MAG: universal stress protein [Methanospirillum sp.]|nr:universal stress protein [Methanospirillum sp.]
MTWRRVLVATDLSEESARTADACLDLPGPPRLLLVHVAGQGGSDPNPALEAEARRLALSGAEVDVRTVPRGDRTVVHALLEGAAEAGADLVAVGARGRGRAVDRLLGSVSSGLLRAARTDLLVVRGERTGPLLARPLVPTDLSETSLEAAERLAAAGGVGEGVLLHVGERVPPALATVAARLGLDPLVRPGAAVPGIVAAAVELRSTAIVLSRVGARDAVAGVRLGPVAEGVAYAGPCPVLVASPQRLLTVVVRELLAPEFPLADGVWRDYHQTRGDPGVDRVFGLYANGTPVSLARCHRHPDGHEVDAVFTPEPFRHRGYSRRVVGALVEACHNEDLYMFAVSGLEGFYGSFGFVECPESVLPPAIRSRYEWAAGNLSSAGVTPMVRRAGWFFRGA